MCIMFSMYDINIWTFFDRTMLYLYLHRAKDKIKLGDLNKQCFELLMGSYKQGLGSFIL